MLPSNYLEHILVVAIGGEFVPVVAKGEFSDAPGSIYRSIISSCRCYMEGFDYWSILVDSGSIVQWLPDLIKHPSYLCKSRCHRMNTESGSESSNRNNISVLFFV